MVSDWFNDDERAVFFAGLKALDEQSHRLFNAAFAELDEQRQLKLLEELEAAASEAPWYMQGNIRRVFDSSAPFICQMKELTAWGFFTSEVGASKVLRYDPMPMRFDGEVPLGPNESSWANYRL